MVYIYLYNNGIAVKAAVKAVEVFWMTAINKLGSPEIFPYFLQALINN